MYNQYFNILSDEEYSICRDIIDNSLWMYNHLSNPESKHKFWMTPPLQSHPFFNGVFMDKIQKLTNTPLQVLRIYANGHTFGQEGDWHKDSPNENDRTFLYYFNEGDSSLLGETYFKNNEGIITDIAQPIHNSAIFFNSNILHRGSAPRITFTDLRITIAFKLRELKIKSNKTLF